jgi:hypothetical protein
MGARLLGCIFRILFQKRVQRDLSPRRPIKGSVWVGMIDPLRMRNGNFAIEVPSNYGGFLLSSDFYGFWSSEYLLLGSACVILMEVFYLIGRQDSC